MINTYNAKATFKMNFNGNVIHESRRAYLGITTRPVDYGGIIVNEPEWLVIVHEENQDLEFVGGVAHAQAAQYLEQKYGAFDVEFVKN